MPKTPKPDSEFAIQLRAYVDVLGVTRSAEICDVSRRTVHLWLKGEGNPNRSTRVGALGLLAINLPPQITHEKTKS